MADARPTANDGPATDTRTDGDAATKADLDAATRAEVTAAAEVAAADTVFDAEVDDYPEDDGRGLGLGLSLSFQSRLTIGLTAAAVLPLAGFGLVVLLIGSASADATLGRVILFILVVAATSGILLASLLAADLTAPLRAIAAAVDRTSAGDLSTPIIVPGEDELARLADSHNRLAADLDRRNRELGRILDAIQTGSPNDTPDSIAGRAGNEARSAFAMIDAVVLLVDPQDIPIVERIPGESLPIRAVLRAGADELGVLIGHLPATRVWDRADQDLLELYASEVAVAIRNAQLFERVESQNSQLLELDAAKDDFLRGVSHNLQTPLRTTICDLGPGVAEPDRARLFRRFERGADRSADDGSGLGLYVSRELCRAMDGDLVLEPPVIGRGAAFSVYLPGEPPEEG